MARHRRASEVIAPSEASIGGVGEGDERREGHRPVEPSDKSSAIQKGSARHSLAMMVVVGVVVCVVYMTTLSPSIGGGDSGELMAVGKSHVTALPEWRM